MIIAYSQPRHLLSLLVMLFIVARVDVGRVEAQGIPLPAETPRAGSYLPPGVKARANKTPWRPKGLVEPAQAEEPVSESEPTAEPTLAASPEEPAGEVQYLYGPANAAETAEEPALRIRPVQTLPPRANPLRQASRPQALPQQYSTKQDATQRNTIQRVQNPVEMELEVEVEAESLPRPVAPRVLQEVPGPRQPLPREAWQLAPGQKYPPRAQSPFDPREEPPHDWPADIQNPAHGPREPYRDDQEQYPDEQVPGEELYGLPRVFETNAYGRFSGRGEPLTAGSWLNRPYYIGGFIGGMGGDTLVEDEIKANGGFFWGGNLGWDYDPYWGIEMRLAFSSQGLDYYANPAYDNAYNELVLWDTSLVYYPWGDARWRPYFKLGVGFADFDYTDVMGIRRSEMVYEMPFGFGMKYRVNQYWTWRFDVTDNLIFGGNAGMETQNQFSLAGGLEYRFGGRRQSYWPWNSSRRWR